jgi:CBS domain-containing protein
VIVAEVMRTPPVCVPPLTTVAEAAKRMRDEVVGCVVVRDGAGLQGILTDRDLAVRVLAHCCGPATKVADVMSTPVMAIRDDCEVQHAYQAFRRHHVRRLPVLHRDEPVGVLFLDDLLRCTAQEMTDLVCVVARCALKERS